jgi:hypothetical protein
MSDTVKTGRYCKNCNKSVMAERSLGIGDGMGCLLCLITGGLFIPLFILLRVINAMGGYRCLNCGQKC